MPVRTQSNVFELSAPQGSHAGARRQTSGFTFIEILTVFVIFGIITTMAIPKFRGYKEQGNLRSAKHQVIAYLTSARAAAIRRSRPSTVTVSANDEISATVDSSGTQLTLATTYSVKNAYAVTLPSGAATVTFDRRGFATSLAATQVIVMSNSRGRDSVCVTRAGVIMTDGCTP